MTKLELHDLAIACDLCIDVAHNNSVWEFDKLIAFAKAVIAAERERIAAEFDRRAVYRDGTPSTGWYEPHEPAEIIRSLK